MIKAEKDATGLNFLTTRQAAERLGISLRTAQLWAESGMLDSWKTQGGHRRIKLESVQRLQGSDSTANLGSPGDLGRLRVVVVEDDNTLLRLYKLAIESWGLDISIYTAANAYDGLMLLGRESPDLLICDLNMPGVDGFQMLDRLMQSNLKEGLEVVVVTGLDTHEIAARGPLPEGIPVLHKPIPFQRLKAICQSLLERRQQAIA